MVGQGLGGNHYPTKAHNESSIKIKSTAKNYVESERFIERDGTELTLEKELETECRTLIESV